MAKKAARQQRALAPIRELVSGDGGGASGNGASEQSDAAAGTPRQHGSGQATGNGSASVTPIIDVSDDLISTQKRIVAGTLPVQLTSAVLLPKPRA